jgi:hypothetical protein
MQKIRIFSETLQACGMPAAMRARSKRLGDADARDTISDLATGAMTEVAS